MKDICRVIATIVIWSSVAGLSYLFNSFGIFDAFGAIGMVIAGVLVTAVVWGEGE